ncbi:hypothetical protein BCR35DRAFT_310234 [Leucosporidium creatinivorum]|uniref:Uncharacterized protein n=1 Tax=Leucosporidium creatinivorum TaxID=106004 RepID=A0A1Y2D717_9BASI|nr:hypothetical protein BCR35DRAFT_310234 [Leucosporidium creatinivorum]
MILGEGRKSRRQRRGRRCSRLLLLSSRLGELLVLALSKLHARARAQALLPCPLIRIIPRFWRKICWRVWRRRRSSNSKDSTTTTTFVRAERPNPLLPPSPQQQQ